MSITRKTGKIGTDNPILQDLNILTVRVNGIMKWLKKTWMKQNGIDYVKYTEEQVEKMWEDYKTEFGLK